MADLGTLLPTTTAPTNPVTDWAVGALTDFDEGISAADTNEVGDDSNVNGDLYFYAHLDNVPADFDTLDTILYNLIYRVTGAQTNMTRNLYIRLVTDEVTPVNLTAEATVATSITATTAQTTGATALTITGSPTKAQMDNALIQLRLNQVKSMAGSANGIRCDTAEITGTYTATSSDPQPQFMMI